MHVICKHPKTRLSFRKEELIRSEIKVHAGLVGFTFRLAIAARLYRCVSPLWSRLKYLNNYRRDCIDIMYRLPGSLNDKPYMVILLLALT